MLICSGTWAFICIETKSPPCLEPLPKGPLLCSAGSCSDANGSISPSNSRDSLASSTQAAAAAAPVQWTFEEDGSFQMRRKRRYLAGVL